MKIVMFQYNRSASAIIQESTMANKNTTSNRMATNSLLAGGYNDRFLWEEAAPLGPKKIREYTIIGNWQ